MGFQRGHCRHCGKEGHSRIGLFGKNGCEEYAKILNANGGNMPASHEGKLYMFLREKNAALGVKACIPQHYNGTEDDSSGDESNLSCCMEATSEEWAYQDRRCFSCHPVGCFH